MSSDRKRTRDEILEEALDLPPSEVAELLDRRCGTDSELRDEVERLLSVCRRMGSGFMGSAPSGWVVPRFEPGQRLGRYEIESLIGAGGMSVVYRALDPGIGRSVAIKVLLLTGEETAAANQRFLAEVRILGSIRHPNVVQVYDFGELHGLPYIVMECLEGEDLAQAIAAGRCGDFACKLTVAKQLATALDHVHQAGIIHRDVKPANVFIERSGLVKVMDFGIARSDGTRATHASALIGTPEYLPPEQVKGEPASRFSDIYSYGILLFELFAGEKPYRGNTAELLYKIVHENIPVDVLRNAALPKPLANLICCATAKNPLERPRSFRQICDALAMVDAAPSSAVVAGPAFHRTNKKKVAAAVLAIVACSTTGLLFRAINRASTAVRPLSNRPVNLSPALANSPASDARLGSSAGLNKSIPSTSAAPLPQAKAKLPAPLDASTSLPHVPPPNPPPTGDRVAGISQVLESSPAASPGAQPREQAREPAGPPVNQAVEVTSTSRQEVPAGEAGAAARDTQSKETPKSIAKLTVPPSLDNKLGQAPAHKAVDNPIPPKNDDLTTQLEARAVASARVLELLREYAAAFSSRNLSAVSNLRNLTPEQRRIIANLFSHNLKVEMTLAPASQPEFDELSIGGTAVDPAPHHGAITVDLTIRLRTNNGELPAPTRARARLGFTRNGATWKISSWE